MSKTIEKYIELEEHAGELVSYKKITEICNLKYYSGGKAKTLQIEDIKRYRILEKVKAKYLIGEQHEIAIEKVDNRKNNRGSDIRNRDSKLYSNYMEQILMHYLLDNEYICMSKYKIISEELNIVSEFANDCSMNGIEWLSKDLGLGNKRGLTSAYSIKMQNIIFSNLSKSLNDLQKRGYIEWNEKYEVLRNSNLDSEILKDTREIDELNSTKSIVMEEMDIDYKHLRIMSINKNFKRNVCNKMQNDFGSDIYNFWKIYEITLVNKEYDFTMTYDEARFEAIKSYMIKLHRDLLNYEYLNIKPYRTEINIDRIIDMSKLMWGKSDENIQDDINKVLLLRIITGAYESRYIKNRKTKEVEEKEIIDAAQIDFSDDNRFIDLENSLNEFYNDIDEIDNVPF